MGMGVAAPHLGRLQGALSLGSESRVLLSHHTGHEQVLSLFCGREAPTPSQQTRLAQAASRWLGDSVAGGFPLCLNFAYPSNMGTYLWVKAVL